MDKNQSTKIVREAMQGNKEALQRLYEEYYKEVYYVCRWLLKDEENAKDMTQEVFAKVCEKLTELRNPEQFKGWITTIANRMCLNQLRHEKIIEFTSIENQGENTTYEVPYKNGQTVEDKIVDSEITEILLKAIEKLPDEQRICIFMYYFENYTTKEIAELMECSENTVKGRIRYGIANLKKQIEDMGDEGIRLRSIAALPFIALIFANNQKKVFADTLVTGTDNFIAKLQNNSKTTNAVKSVKTVKTAGELSMGKVAAICAGIAVITVGGIFGAKMIGSDTGKSGKEKTESEQSVTAPKEIKGAELVKKIDLGEEWGNIALRGNTYYMWGKSDVNKATYVKKLSDGKTVYEVEDTQILAERTYKDLRIIEFKDSRELCVFSLDGRLLYKDKACRQEEEGTFYGTYKDERFLNKENNLVYISQDGEDIRLKCVSLDDFKLIYEMKIESKPAVLQKSLYYISYEIGDTVYVVNICTGETVFEFTYDGKKSLYLSGENFVILETEDGYLKKFTQYNGSGEVGVEKIFTDEKITCGREKLNGINSSVCTGDYFIIGKYETTQSGVVTTELGIVKSDFSMLVDYQKYMDVEIDSALRLSGNYADIPIIVDRYERAGYILLENEIIEFSNINYYDAELGAPFVEVITNEEKHLVINLETGKYFEVAEGDFLEVSVTMPDNKIFVVEEKTNGKYSFYNADGEFLCESKIKFSSSLAANLSENGKNISYDDKATNTVYVYSIEDKEESEFKLKDDIYYGLGVVLEKYYIYGIQESGNIILKAYNIEDGTETKLCTVEDKRMSISLSDYGFIIKDTSDSSIELYRFK